MDKSMAAKQGLQSIWNSLASEFLNGMNLLARWRRITTNFARSYTVGPTAVDVFMTALQTGGMKAEDLRNISSTSDRIAEMMV